MQKNPIVENRCPIKKRPCTAVGLLWRAHSASAFQSVIEKTYASAMAANISDFDDIFGDLKEDQSSMPSLTSPSFEMTDGTMFADTKSTAAASCDKSMSISQPEGKTATDTDDFLAWLDSPATPVPPDLESVSSTDAPTEACSPQQTSGEMQTIDLGDDQAFVTSIAQADASVPPYSVQALDIAPVVDGDFPTSIPVQVHPPPAISSGSISLLDDDDLDAFAEKAQAQLKKNGSRESSYAALRIKSQCGPNSQTGAQIDLTALQHEYVTKGKFSNLNSRFALWTHVMCGGAAPPSISQYSVQTTPLDMVNQSVLRKDVESTCASLFSTDLMNSRSTDALAASRLLFIDNMEILTTYLCKSLSIDYVQGLCNVLAPVVAASEQDPLRVDLIVALLTAIPRVLPCLAHHLSLHIVANARRPLLQRLALYHVPHAAMHLQEHFHRWPNAIPDTWLGSLMERDGVASTISVWDCCVLVNDAIVPHVQTSTIVCFIIMFLLRQAEAKLLRMEGEQLSACFLSTLQDCLRSAGDAMALGVLELLDNTPSNFCFELRDAGMAEDAPVDDAASRRSSVTGSSKFSLLSASTNGVKQVSNMVIDMPTKLFTTVVPMLVPVSGSAKEEAAPIPVHTFLARIQQETATRTTTSLCMQLPAEAIIPSVFRSQPTAEHVRYFVIDCRSNDERRQGHVPTSFAIDSEAVTSSSSALESVMSTLEAIKKAMHICVMGHGYAHIAEDLLRQPNLSEQSLENKEGFLDAVAQDAARVDATVLYLIKRGFPHVSIIRGGYVAIHAQLLQSSSDISVDDLTDHDAPQCALCQHQRAMFGIAAATQNSAGQSYLPALGPTSPSQPSGGPERTAKSVFDAHASPTANVLNSFASALKTGGKVVMKPGDSLKDSTNWLLKKTGGMASPGSSNATSPTNGSASTSPSAAAGLANLAKFTTSLTHMGVEGLKRVEQATVTMSKYAFVPSGTPPVSPTQPTGLNVGSNSHGNAASKANVRTSSSHSTTDQLQDDKYFTIDEDEEEEPDDFVTSGGASSSGRTSSASSRTSSVSKSLPVSAEGAASALSIYTLMPGHIGELRKGMHVQRSEMQMCAASPFFAAYKKKRTVVMSPPAPPPSMLPRRIVVVEQHLVVLKAERRLEDVFMVKSCHSLSQLARMTCLKNNALVVTLYFEWTNERGAVMRKKNAYDIQQREEFIKAVQHAMEQMEQ